VQYFLGIQGGPLEHIIAGKGICFEEALQPEFKDYAKQVVYNAKIFAQRFISNGWHIISNGTENHMFVVDVYGSAGLTGKQAESCLDAVNITVNKNQIPNDTLPPLKSSGIRIGTPAMTTRGFGEKEFIELADIMDEVLRGYAEECRKYGDDASFDAIKDYAEAVNNLVKGLKHNGGKD